MALFIKVMIVLFIIRLLVHFVTLGAGIYPRMVEFTSAGAAWGMVFDGAIIGWGMYTLLQGAC